jgi:hypothetical protein
VRETAAQALGAALQPTSLLTLQRVLELLSSMHKHHEWSVRHGAFTGDGAYSCACGRAIVTPTRWHASFCVLSSCWLLPCCMPANAQQWQC